MPAHALRLLFLSLVCTLFVGLPALSGGFDHDELWQLQYLEGMPVRGGSDLSPTSMWTFGMGTAEEQALLEEQAHRGEQPWCFAGREEPMAKMRFFRPLPSLLLVAEHGVFGLDPLPFHGLNLLWFAAFATVVGLLFIEVLPRTEARFGRAAGALVLFLATASHAEVLSRYATRHLVLAGLFGIGAVLLHVRWRTGQAGWLRWASLACVVGALFSGENALQALAYLAAFELLAGPGSRRERARSLAPAAAVVVGYLALYAGAGLGGSGAGYLDPFGAPASVLLAAPLRVAELAIEALLAVPAWRPWNSSPWWLVGVPLPEGARVALGGVVLAGAGLAAHRLSRKPGEGAIAWLTLGSLLALVPSLAAQPGPRALLLPGIGVAALVATAIAHGWERARQTSLSLAARLGPGLLAGALVAVHGALSLGALNAHLNTLSDDTSQIEQRWRAPQEVGAPPPQTAEMDWSEADDVIVLVAPSTATPRSFEPVLREVRRGDAAIPRPAGQRWWFLSNNMLDYAHSWTRLAPNRFELALTRPLRPRPFTRSLWIDCFGRPGQVSKTGAFDVVVLETHSDGSPVRIGVETRRDLDDPSVWWVRWSGGALRRIRPPAVGETLSL